MPRRGARVTPRRVFTPLDAQYPSRLRGLPDAPSTLTVCGGSLEASTTVAIVGSRESIPEAAAFAHGLARALAACGAVVVSGGAAGVDAAAHRGALDASGRTWAVAATGPDRCYPREHSGLFEAIAAGPGAMIWPFEGGWHRSGFLVRNRLLVALADAVVVVQAGAKSGALHAAGWAVRLHKALWVVPVAPWTGAAFVGSRHLLEHGARCLFSKEALLTSLGLTPGASEPPPRIPLNDQESMVLAATSTVPRHIDAITDNTHLPIQAIAAALLTLALENVVVEGPPGFFRRSQRR